MCSGGSDSASARELSLFGIMIWNPFWKDDNNHKSFTCWWWVGDFNGNWIWTRREELLQVLTELDANRDTTQHLTYFEGIVPFSTTLSTWKTVKLVAGFSQRTIATGNSAFQSRFSVEKMMSVTSFTIVTQLQSTSGWFENRHLLVVYISVIHFIEYKHNSVHS